MTQPVFHLTEDFVEPYKTQEPPFGFRDVGGNSLGEITFIRTYSRLINGENKERWVDTATRVTNATYTIQKQYIKEHKLEWSDQKAQASAKEFFDRLFKIKFTPPGRGLQQMGSPQVMAGNSASLQNCGFVSTADIQKYDPGAVFEWAMLALMYGIGIGADTLGSKKNIEVRAREGSPEVFVVPDSREGWAESLRLLINSYLRKNKPIEFDYSLIRPKGAPLVSFGGKASGPDPLVRLHAKISEIFEARLGKTLDAETITDIMNLIGSCVIAGSTRRSAEIILGEYGDDDFLNLKNPDKFAERNSYDPDNPGWAWASNNSVVVPVGADYSQYKDRISANGEPGLVWLDVIKNYGRLIDPPDNKDVRTRGVNPCITADSYLFTEKGLITFGEAYLNGNKQTILSDTRISFDKVGIENDPDNWSIGTRSNIGSEFVEASHVFMTQRDADIVRVETSGGIFVRVTPDHLIATKMGMVQAKDLSIGDKILVTPAPLPQDEIGEPQTLEEKEAFIMGLVAGDGTFTAGKITEKVYIDLWGKDREFVNTFTSYAQDIYDANTDMVKSGSNRSFTPYLVSELESRSLIRIGSSFLAALLKHKYSFSRETKHSVPKRFLDNARSRAARFYIAGLAFADGTVNKYNKVGSCSIRINQSNRDMLSDVQLILLANGVSSALYLRRNAGLTELPDGCGGTKMYNTKANYEIVVMMHAYEYTKYIGFGPSVKQQLAESIFTSPSRKKNAYASVLSVTPDGSEDVYCLTEPKRHTLVANGISMRQCGEQPLESYELCTLTTVHINNADSKEDFLRTLKFAFLYAKTVTLMPSPWTRTNSIMQRNRRIGLSLTGITDFVDSHGLPELIDWMEAGYEEVRRLDDTYSEWMCVRESNRVSTIKPEGSVSLLSGASPGIHWGPGGKFYLRAIRFGKSDQMLHLFEAAGYKVEDDLVSADTAVVYFPMKTDSSRSEQEVSIFEKIGLAAKAQHHWSDNGVSVTVSFDPETEKELIVPALRLHEGSLKAVSFLPMSTEAYPQQPYTKISQEDYESYVGQIQKIDFSAIYDGVDNLEAIGERYCSNDNCQI